jgi:putative peptidoglycan lipid II flippase
MPCRQERVAGGRQIASKIERVAKRRTEPFLPGIGPEDEPSAGPPAGLLTDSNLVPSASLVDAGEPERRTRFQRVLGILRPSHAHSAYTATLLLMTSSLLSGLLGLARGKYIAWLFGAGPQTDAYQAAFRLPDLMNNFLVGGAVGITFVTILNRYRERGEEAEGERVLSIVLNCVGIVLIVAITVLMFLAGPYIRYTNPGFTAEQVALSARMTRILLPGQFFFFTGGVLGATLLVRKQFLYQALTPILYNFCIIGTGVLLAGRMGVSALALGATIGAFLGAFAINAMGAARAGVRYTLGIDLHHPGLLDWLKMTLPFMFGFTLPFLDPYFVGYYASHGAGDISRLTNAKQLFSAPMAVLASAAGAASMPFFAKLWAQGKQYEFATEVANSVSRVSALCILAASGMIAMAPLLVGVVFRGGAYTPEIAAQTSRYFVLYTFALFLWSAQAIYSRAFYATGMTWLPMLSGSVVMVVAFPFYGIGYRLLGAAGLALATDIGILLQTVALAVLLHRRRMVSLADVDYRELGRCIVAGSIGGGAVWAALLGVNRAVTHHPRWLDLLLLALGSLLWTAIAGLLLNSMGSALPRAMMKRVGIR